MSSSAPRAAVHRLGAVGRRQDDAGRAAGRRSCPISACRGPTRRARCATGETDGVDYNFVTPRALRGDDRRRRVPRVGRRVRQPLRHRAPPTPSAHAGRRAATSCWSSTCRARGRCGRAASSTTAIFVHAAVVRGARAAAARPQQGQRGGDPAAAGDGARGGRPRSPSTTTSSSTTSSTRRRSAARPSSWPSASRPAARWRPSADAIVRTFTRDDT